MTAPKPVAAVERPDDTLDVHSCESGACEVQCRYCPEKFCVESDRCLKQAITELDAMATRVADLESRAALLGTMVDEERVMKEAALAQLAEARAEIERLKARLSAEENA